MLSLQIIKPFIETHSFPSSHAANMMVSVTVLFLFYRRWGILGYVIALTVCYSRLYTAAHWPTDVMTGAIIGIAMANIVVRFMNQAWQKWGKKYAPVFAERYPSLL